jgi:hypothetical protein
MTGYTGMTGLSGLFDIKNRGIFPSPLHMEGDSRGEKPCVKPGQNPGEDIFPASVEIFVILTDQA